jgi:hypothetical protein
VRDGNNIGDGMEMGRKMEKEDLGQPIMSGHLI